VTRPSFTAAVCTLNRIDTLGRTLDGLAAQRFAGRWDVLVVDNGSTDGSRNMLEARVGEFPVPLRVVSESRRGIGFARNRALRETSASIVLFTDDDAVCRAGWIEAHARAFADREVVGTGGRILPVLPKGTPDWYETLVSRKNGGPTSRYDFGDEAMDMVGKEDRLFPFAANMGVRRDAALGAGGFREDLGWGSEWLPGEETDLMCRLFERGGRVRYVPEAVVEHHVLASRVTWPYWRKWQLGFGRSTVRVDPPLTRADRYAQMTECLWQIARWNLRAFRRRLSSSAYRMHRARLAALFHRGRLAELLSSRPASARAADQPSHR